MCETVNPYILNKIRVEINNKNYNHFVIDAPTLFESGAYRFCDYSIAILSDKHIRIERILSRDKISYFDAICRVNIQPKDDFYLKYADEVVFNNGRLCLLIRDVERVLNKLL